MLAIDGFSVTRGGIHLLAEGAGQRPLTFTFTFTLTLTLTFTSSSLQSSSLTHKVKVKRKGEAKFRESQRPRAEGA